jgi:hypothetical protein
MTSVGLLAATGVEPITTSFSRYIKELITKRPSDSVLPQNLLDADYYQQK